MGEQPDTSLDEFDLDALEGATNENFVNLRKHARKLEQALKAERKAHGETSKSLETLQTEARTGSVKAAAKAKGLTDEQVDAFLSFKPDATTEQVDAFVKMFAPVTPAGEAEAEGENEETSTEAPPPAGFVPASGGSVVPPKGYSNDDIVAAARRGDKQSLERMAAAAVKDPSKLDLKYAHLIEDD